LKLIGNSISDNKVLDSLHYVSKHQNLKSITDETFSSSEKLSKKGFLENQLETTIQENDSTYVAKFHLGERIKSIRIYIGTKNLPTAHSKGEGEEQKKQNKSALIKNLIGLDKTKDSLVLPYEEIEYFLNNTLKKSEQRGYAFAKLQLVNIQKKNSTLYAELQFESGPQRQLNAIVVKFGENSKKVTFPAGHLKQINRKEI
jgi:hypothetical protein